MSRLAVCMRPAQLPVGVNGEKYVLSAELLEHNGALHGAPRVRKELKELRLNREEQSPIEPKAALIKNVNAISVD